MREEGVKVGGLQISAFLTAQRKTSRGAATGSLLGVTDGGELCNLGMCG